MPYQKTMPIDARALLRRARSNDKKVYSLLTMKNDSGRNYNERSCIFLKITSSCEISSFLIKYFRYALSFIFKLKKQ